MKKYTIILTALIAGLLAVCTVERNNPLDEHGEHFIPPTVEVDTSRTSVRPDDTTHFDSVKISLKGNNIAASRFQAKLDLGSWIKWQKSGDFSFHGLKDGRHTIYFETMYDGGIMKVDDSLIFCVQATGYKPDYSITTDTTINAHTGAAITIIAAVNGKTPMFFKWTKNGSLCDDKVSDTLKINNLTLSDSGIYQCISNNEFGSDTSRSFKISFSLTPDPPINLMAIYDTLSGIVHLRWQRVKMSDIDGYVVYRNDTSSSNPIAINDHLIKDTTFNDTIFHDSLNINNFVYFYRVKTQDKSANLSAIFSDPVKVSVPSPTLVRTRINITCNTSIDNTASINDTVLIIANYANNERNNKLIQWFTDSDTLPIKEKKCFYKSGIDTLVITSAVNTIKNIRLKIIDETNHVWSDSINFKFITDEPLVFAGKDDSCAINTKYVFNGTVKQMFGSIKIYKWDYDGDRVWDDSSTTIATGSYLYKHEGDFNVVFGVTDDDNNSVSDTMKLKITNMPPTIHSIRNDTTISINDTVVFSAFATDTEGIVKSYSWDYDGDGTFDITNLDGAGLHMYPAAGNYNAILKVTDDNDKSVLDTVKITVLQDTPVISEVEFGSGTLNPMNPNQIYTFRTDTSYNFYISAKQQFGTIKIYKLDFDGDGVWDDSSSTNNLPKVFLKTGTYHSRFYVRDDDGNEAISKRQITVANLISNNIKSNFTFHKLGSPYIITGAVTVAKGCTLTVEPGTILKYKRNEIPENEMGIYVAGVLKCIGSVTDSIIVDSLMLWQIGGCLNIEYTKFTSTSIEDHADRTVISIDGYGGYVNITHSLFVGGHMVIGATSNNSYIEKNNFLSFGSITCQGTDSTKIYIKNNGFYTITLNELNKAMATSPEMLNAIKNDSVYSSKSQTIIEKNTFTDTTKVYVYYNGPMTVINNYWNTQDEITIRKMIYGSLTYSPFLTAPDPETPIYVP